MVRVFLIMLIFAVLPVSMVHAGNEAVTRIALGSCAFQWEDQAILDRVVESRPDLYLSLGDAIYADFDGKQVVLVTPESLQAEWNKLAALPAFLNLRNIVPIMATWDNHDYGCHDCGAEFSLKNESEQIFLDFWQVPAGSEVRERPGVYQSKVFGEAPYRAQIVLLDTRTFRDRQLLAKRPEGVGGSLGKYVPNSDSAAKMLGEAQWAWLEQQLQQPAELRFIASSTQIVADQKGMDEWGNYPLERERLLDLIGRTGAEGVILLSGNVHFSELSRTEEGSYPLYEFTSSGLTHVNEEYPQAANDYRVGEPVVKLNFGLVDIDWKADGEANVTFRVVGASGGQLFEKAISTESLRTQ
jgi:alkaline phosphatase D